ncbi:MAG: HAD family hydrolase [Syntrophales bacterium]|jgi:phosphoglycolate phosphatase|nr:HAD family hydrolase [Syntrophales bacterium]
MRTEVDLMIFDFDGTLVQTGEGIVKSVNFTLNRLNLPTIAGEEILTFIGDGVVKLIERATGEEGRAYRERAMEIFSDHYGRHMMDQAELYPGVHDLLRHFAEKRKIILTNKRYGFTKKMAEALALDGFFEEIIGADSTPFIKPAPELMQAVLSRYPVARNRVVMIGDGVNDLLLAKESGVIGCAFLNGLGDREELLALGPDITFEDFGELKERLA